MHEQPHHPAEPSISVTRDGSKGANIRNRLRPRS